ncbi:MAG: winged helix-turn-helix domain-containing protein [Rhizobiaceae bacterium]|nr:winged helix DNA-binding domain-containing protein [Hyphomicrobiales bacterium]NRB29576.1 winged helix-turn-helix domain-containing protein [Rhizobiaceae bacterium]
MSMIISNQQARRLILHLQGLTRPPHKAFGPGELGDLITQLGYVQLDSIQWVERAQHMILFARSQAYRPKHLTKLIEKERFLFENWTHDAAVIPSSFYPYWRHKFVRHKEKLDAKFTNWQGGGYLSHCDGLMATIAENGALRSRDLDRPDTGPMEMWQWHDGKAALEYLWRTGQLCISQREGFQKVYDLAERGIPDEHFNREVDHDEFVDWACRSALERLGFGTAADISRYWDLISISEVRDWIERQGGDRVGTVTVVGQKKDQKEFFARPDIADLLADLPDSPARIRVLSPFDPVIRNRNRLEWLFGFEYRIEIYVPEEKRRWGYYVFPLLEGDKLIGRIDMRAKRKEGVLEVKSLWLEPKVKMSTARADRLNAELTRQARLGGVNSVVWLEGAHKY